MIAFDDILQQYGGDPASLLKFHVDGPELLPYATLTAARLSGDLDLAALGGMYEWQDRPLLFLVDGTLLDGNPQRLSRIRRLRRRSLPRGRDVWRHDDIPSRSGGRRCSSARIDQQNK